MKYSNEIKDLIEIIKSIDNFSNFLKKNKSIINQLKKETSFLQGKISARERLWYVENDTNKPPTCKICNNPVKWENHIKTFQTYCSTKCAHQDNIVRIKTKQTNLERYGVEHIFQNKKIKEKIKITNLKRFGVENSMQSKEVQNKSKQTKLEKYKNKNYNNLEKNKQTKLKRYGDENYNNLEKVKQTNLERYGVECTLKLEKVQEKIKTTNLELFGVENVFASNKITNKIKITNLERFNVEKPLQNKEILNKMQNNNLEKYGVKCTFELNKVREKSKQTCIEKYGSDHFARKNISNNTLKKLNDKNWLIKQHHNNKMTCEHIANKLNVHPTTIANYLRLHKINIRYFMQSQPERDIIQFLNNNNIKTHPNRRDLIQPKELDIYIPEYNLAIEYCGLYWHSDQYKNKHYHQNKLNMCQQNNIRLITLFEDEWLNKQNIVKSKLLSILYKDITPSIYARKCNIINVSTRTKKQFYDEFHIQGDGPSSINIGLIYENKLVACMGFIKRQNKLFELNRYATSCKVPGGFSKLLKYFQNNYNWNEIKSFADLRWSNGDLYANTGWNLDSTLKPDYSYSIDGIHRYHKFNFRQNKLKKILSNFNPLLTEFENCDNNEILRIWDCGKKRYVIKNI